MKKGRLCACLLLFLLLLLPQGCEMPAFAPKSSTDFLFAAQTEAAAEASPAGETQKETTQEATMAVYVCGSVQEPGVVFLSKGARLYEAVEAAGGLREDAAAESINLAAEVFDGSRLYIPAEGETMEESAAAAVSPGTPGLVNINTATLQELMTLNGIGQAKAAAIIDYRQTQGAFFSIEDIMKVPGIKQALFQKMKDRITTG